MPVNYCETERVARWLEELMLHRCWGTSRTLLALQAPWGESIDPVKLAAQDAAAVLRAAPEHRILYICDSDAAYAAGCAIFSRTFGRSLTYYHSMNRRLRTSAQLVFARLREVAELHSDVAPTDFQHIIMMESSTGFLAARQRVLDYFAPQTLLGVTDNVDSHYLRTIGDPYENTLVRPSPMQDYACGLL